MNRYSFNFLGIMFVSTLTVSALGRPAAFIHPSYFNDTPNERNLVIAFIQSNVKRTIRRSDLVT